MSEGPDEYLRQVRLSGIEEAARRFAQRPRAGRPLPKGRFLRGRVNALQAPPALSTNGKGSGVMYSPELKMLFYLWVFFLVMEGAFRKWFLPNLATPLLLVRDPILIAMFVVAISRQIFPTGRLLLSTQVLGVLTFCTAFLSDRFIPLVALYGWRSNFFYLPFIFLLPRFMTRDDVVALGRWWLLAAIPMSFLLVAQFRQSPDAFINIGVGGSEAFTTMYGKVRTSGTFSFVNGTVAFIGLTTVFLCYGLLQPGTYPGWLIFTSGISTGISIAVSGSRSAVFVVTQILIGILVAGLYHKRHLGPALRMSVALLLIGFIVTRFDVAEEGLEVHTARFKVAAQQESILMRLFNEFHVPFWLLKDIPTFGYGLGLGTNVGAAYTTGNRGFLLAENDWSRVVLEVGFLMGLPFLAMRIMIFLYLLFKAHRLLRQGEILPVILLTSSSLTIMAGQLGQPTGLGFMVLTSGLVGAACNTQGRKGSEPTNSTQLFAVNTRGNFPTRRAKGSVQSRSRSDPPIRG